MTGTTTAKRPERAVWQSLWVETDDHALIHVRVAGREEDGPDRSGPEKPALVLLHGWSLSAECFERQAPLAERFQVVCPDLRAHGLSSKVLHGHTLPDYGRDVARVADGLGLERFVLAGWSMAGPLALECWERLGPERIAGLALVEMSPAPLSGEPWNTHGLRGGDLDGLMKVLSKIERDRRAHLELFVRAMFADGRGTERECRRLLEQGLRCPGAAASAIYSDYALRDYAGTLAGITVPCLAAFGSSPHLCFGPVPAQYLAATVPDCRAALFQDSGHMPFYEEPEAFNLALVDLAERAGLA